MSRKVVKELILEGLDCANCATKIEGKVGALQGVNNTSMNFVTKTLSMDIEDEGKLDGILEQARSIINKLEPHVVVSEKVITKAAKKVLLLMGLCCANCATKIEREVKNLSGVTDAHVDFGNKKLVIEAKSKHEMAEIIEAAKKIVNKIEPDVQVVMEEESKKERTNKKEFVIEGLNCAGCIDKMELGIKTLEGIKDVSIDFTTKKLRLEINNNADLQKVGDEVRKIVKKIEPDVNLIEKEEKRTKADEHDHERGHGEAGSNKKKLIRLAVGAAFFASGFLFRSNPAVEFSLFFISYILVGGEVLLKSARNILRGQVFDENFLMSIATIGAFSIKQYPEGVAVMLFYQLGEFFQDLAVNRSRKSISALMDIRPDFANLKVGADTKKVSPEEVNIGDLIIVKPGEKVPLDGKVAEGESMVDTSALTGESVPREATPGSDILSGFINKNGVLTVEVTKEFGESTVSKILDLVQNASSKKAPTENFITKFARYYTPAVVFIAAALAVIPPLVIPGATFSTWLYRALVFLVVSCPCALVVSIPLGFFGGIGGASRRGVLIKGSNYLEALNSVETVVFDKTGTLTKGVFKVTEVKTEGNIAEADLLEYAAYVESYSNHPIATSIQKAYGKDINKAEIENYEEISGHGIKAKIRGREVLAGNSKLMQKENIAYEMPDVMGTIVHIAFDGSYAGYIVIADEIKEDAEKAIKELKKVGVKKTVMLTGDIKAVGQRVGEKLGLDEVHAELLPDQKVEKLEMLEKQRTGKGKLIFVGDGINDAPVLARADIGVAMGGLGSDAAIEAADVVIMTDEPSKLANAIRIARRTRAIVWQNIILAMVIKGVVLILGAGGIATIWEAVFADVGVTVMAVFNSMRVMDAE